MTAFNAVRMRVKPGRVDEYLKLGQEITDVNLPGLKAFNVVKTGERRWRGGRYGHGQTLLVGDLLLVTTEDGEIVLVEPTPEAHREVARFTVFDGKTWNPPAVAGKYLLVRTDKEAALYELTLEGAGL